GGSTLMNAKISANPPPLEDGIAPFAGLVAYPMILVAHPAFPAKTVPELIDYAKSNPGKVTMASFGIGTASHLAGELLKQLAVIARLDREIGSVLAEPTIQARLADLGTVPMPLNAQEFAAFIAAESEKWGKVVRIANIAPQ